MKRFRSRAKAWIRFLVVEVVMLIMVFYCFYNCREISIDECETFTDQIIDIKYYTRVKARDIVCLKTNFRDLYIVCYNKADRDFPKDELLKEKQLTISTKKDVGIINFFYNGREIVDLRSDTSVYLDIQKYNDHMNISRIGAYVCLPFVVISATFLLTINCFGIDLVIKLIEFFVGSRNKHSNL